MLHYREVHMCSPKTRKRGIFGFLEFCDEIHLAQSFNEVNKLFR